MNLSFYIDKSFYDYFCLCIYFLLLLSCRILIIYSLIKGVFVYFFGRDQESTGFAWWSGNARLINLSGKLLGVGFGL